MKIKGTKTFSYDRRPPKIEFNPLCWPWPELSLSPNSRTYYKNIIRNILVNEEKRLVTVVFSDDGSHEIIKCAKEDHFDVKVGVALAIAQHIYGSKTSFHKDVDKKTKFLEKKKESKGKK